MNVHGYEFIWEDWKNNSSSKTALTTKGGKKYFLKRYTTPVAPMNNGSLTPKAMELNQRRFDKFVEIRSSINKEIRKFAASGGDIIIPAAEFIDENAYVEASEWIENVVKDDDVEGILKTLTPDVKMNLLLTATGALKTIHAHNIIHSDLKLKNILLAKNMSGTYSARLIDFDNSYFVGKLPDELVGDINYYSPELGAYKEVYEDAEEDELPALGASLTTKSDIFSLGLIFHYYLTGEFVTFADLVPPLQARAAAGKSIFPWVVANTGGRIVLNESKIGNPFFVQLINAMLAKDYRERPDSSEVYMALKLKKLGPQYDKFKPGSMATSSSGGASSGVTSSTGAGASVGAAPAVLRVAISPAALNIDAGNSANLVPAVTVSGGASQAVTWTSSNPAVATVNASGTVTGVAPGNAFITATSSADATKKGTCNVTVRAIGITRPGVFEEPWPDHNIEFNIDKMKSRGILGLVREEQFGVKGYGLYSDLHQATTLFRKVEILLAIGYAKKVEKRVVVEPGEICEPYPEHGIVFDEEAIRAKNYVKVERNDATKTYRFTDKNGIVRDLNPQMCVILKLAKRV